MRRKTYLQESNLSAGNTLTLSSLLAATNFKLLGLPQSKISMPFVIPDSCVVITLLQGNRRNVW